MFDPSNPDMNCTKFPKDKNDSRFASTGDLIANTPTICGGYLFVEGGMKYLKTCSAIGNPNMTMEMLESRTYATSLRLNSTTLWVIGGLNEREASLNSTELVTWGKSPIKGPILPSPLHGSCSVKYNSTSIYIIGGTGRNKDTWIFDPSNNLFARKGPSSLQHGRSYQSCGIVRSKRKSYIVVAGGIFKSGAMTNSVEILDPMSNKGWIKGKVGLPISVKHERSTSIVHFRT